MAYTENTLFEVTVSNSVHNQTQNVSGKFGTGTGASFMAADVSAGTLCVQNGNLPLEGYETLVDSSKNPKYYNGNSWYFNAAANGKSGGRYGDHTGIYASNTYDVPKAVQGKNTYNIGADTIGLGVPAGERSDFTEIIIGEQYTFGAGNFTAAVGTKTYFTISNGFLTPAAAPASGSGVYFKLIRTKDVNYGTRYFGKGYVLEALRTAEAAPAGN